MADSNFTTDDLAKLDAAIASGALRVRYGDKEVIYKSTKEMLQARRLIRKELGLSPDAPLRKVGSHSKGF